jgi:hypothetical protein
MTPEDVRKLVQKIKEEVDEGDDEMLHVKEDALYQEVLEAIADGSAENPSECARIALETSKFDFARWCA